MGGEIFVPFKAARTVYLAALALAFRGKHEFPQSAALAASAKARHYIQTQSRRIPA